jgi:hypothetical protein
MEPPLAPAPAQPTGTTMRPRFVVRRGNSTNLEPLVGTTKEEVEARLDREVTSGQVQEIDLYEYVGTVKVKRTSEMVNVFEVDK